MFINLSNLRKPKLILFFRIVLVFLLGIVALSAEEIKQPNPSVVPKKDSSVTSDQSKPIQNPSPDQNPIPNPNSNANPFTNLFEREDNQRPMEIFNQVYEHRLMIRTGWGIGKLSPAILNETGPAWFQNSLFRQMSEPGAPLSIPYKPAKDLGLNSQFFDIRYGYKNKYEIQFAEDTSLGVYSRDLPASNNFISPRTDSYWASSFEGNRLLRFEGVSQHLRFSYTHPITKILMVGPSVNFHRYTERNNISYGSYSTSRPEATVPNKVTWSIGGDANAEYSMKGILPGVYAKLKLKDWWEIRGRLELLDRKGNFSVLGSQIIQEVYNDGTSNLTGVVPAYGGKVRDKGTILNLETSFQYCRFSLDIGMIRQDVKRNYDTYLGDTIGNVPRTDYSSRSVGIGFSEMSTSIKHTVTEFYIMPGVSFYYDEDKIY
ncbi:hypothetical protein EHQ92_08225 [Leptospira biflexa]|uniref:hypothetical protein n=1 Tax=Leptospira biflexa TaxID=172 RepID=UPI00109119B3|nr:hypothetical protein [Leptospira biflexa]TGM47879.1 hypothetical protein EHQ92_08225 [Leptospira biflexa]TGM49655.1 hypothetical protein EHQ88_04860 [Leptospira biflexa]